MEMERNEEVNQQSNLLRGILFAIKKNIIFILITIILITGLGIVYSFIRKPTYTSYCSVQFFAEDKEYKIAYEEGKISESAFTKQDVNTMDAYLFSVIDFCDEMVVVDRANYYYDQYLKAKEQNENYTLKDYVASLKIEDNYVFDENAEYKDKYIVQKNVKLATSAEKYDKQYFFAIGYVDGKEEVAKEKNEILIVAANNEVQNGLVIGGEQTDYFAGVGVSLFATNNPSTSIDLSKTKIVLIAFAIGIVLAVILVYLKSLFDNTLKGKDELAMITDSVVLACIADQEEEKTHGRK